MGSHAVFLRAVNVGGTGVTSVAALARSLGLVNIGAAGTFVAHESASAQELRARVAAALPFETPVMVVAGAKVLRLVDAAPLANEPGRPFVAILAGAPRARPTLPLGDGKGARLVAVEPPFALAVVEEGAKPGTTPGRLVERALGVEATVRGWPTMERVAKALRSGPANPRPRGNG